MYSFYEILINLNLKNIGLGINIFYKSLFNELTLFEHFSFSWFLIIIMVFIFAFVLLFRYFSFLLMITGSFINRCVLFIINKLKQKNFHKSKNVTLDNLLHSLIEKKKKKN